MIPVWIVSPKLVISAQTPITVIDLSLLQEEELSNVCILALLIKAFAYLGGLMEIATPDFDFYDPDEIPAPNHYWLEASEKLKKEGFSVLWDCVESKMARHLDPIVTPPFEILD